MSTSGKQTFSIRLAKHEEELKQLYYELYSDNGFYPVDTMYNKLITVMTSYFSTRNEKYKKTDEQSPHWYMEHDVVAATLYVDLFSTDLKHFKKHIPYFKDLGINLIHFMPILECRKGENDGGYAVSDYKHIDPKFGTDHDFDEVLKSLKSNNIHACIDFIVNHTAKEHAFAKEALNGNKTYMDMYFMYDDDRIPRKFEESVPEVFPKVSPGNFTYYDAIHKWVFTSFYEFQWDLNYKNPLVFEKIIDILLYLANLGIDMIRLDAIPFMWKELGTSCRNHPTIHKLLRLFNLITGIVCPSVALLGEAIVQPEEIIKYYGETAPECNVMYNATYMVNLWNSIATRDTRLLQIDAKRLKPLSGGCWINYARCHDDIGWGFNEDATRQMGFDPYSHKQFLIEFYEGKFPGSFSVGDLYEFDPKTMDARNCGTMASLLGLEKALQERDSYQKELALKRINLIHSIVIASSGIPLIYSGDEIATLNNYAYLQDEHKAHDSRWLHRGYFDHKRAKNKNNRGSHEGYVYQSLKKMIALRKLHPIFSPRISQLNLNTFNNHIYAFYKQSDSKELICLFNFSEDRQFISCQAFHDKGFTRNYTDLITGKIVDFSKEELLLGPYEYLWLTP